MRTLCSLISHHLLMLYYNGVIESCGNVLLNIVLLLLLYLCDCVVTPMYCKLTLSRNNSQSRCVRRAHALSSRVAAYRAQALAMAICGGEIHTALRWVNVYVSVMDTHI
jgi:hypothetical protein